MVLLRLELMPKLDADLALQLVRVADLDLGSTKVLHIRLVQQEKASDDLCPKVIKIFKLWAFVKPCHGNL